MKPNAYLLVVGPPQGARVYPVSSHKTLIGRGRECHLRLQYPTVSRRHCEIWADEGKILLQDLGSNNGTLVNGTLVNGKRIQGTRVKTRNLEIGDLIQVGPLVLQLVRAHAAHDSVFDVGDADIETVDTRDTGPAAAALGLGKIEREIVRMLVEGRTEKQVATALQLKPNAVHYCTKQLYQQLGISSRAELCAWYWRNGMGETPPPA